MKTIVIYDSVFGNTEKVAEAIAGELHAELINVNERKNISLKNIDLLVIGSPTHGGRATDEIQKFIDSIPETHDRKFATFDTRSNMKWVKIFGFAADRIALALKDKGGVVLGNPTGFFVSKKQGPLLDPEIERAVSWAKNLLKN